MSFTAYTCRKQTRVYPYRRKWPFAYPHIHCQRVRVFCAPAVAMLVPRVTPNTVCMFPEKVQATWPSSCLPPVDTQSSKECYLSVRSKYPRSVHSGRVRNEPKRSCESIYDGSTSRLCSSVLYSLIYSNRCHSAAPLSEPLLSTPQNTTPGAMRGAQSQKRREKKGKKEETHSHYYLHTSPVIISWAPNDPGVWGAEPPRKTKGP